MEEETIIGIIKRMPEFQKILEQEKEVSATKEERQRKAEELAELRAFRPPLVEKLQTEKREIEKAMKAAQDAYREAQTRFCLMQDKECSEIWAHDQKIRECESFLRRTVPSETRMKLDRLDEQIESHKQYYPRTYEGLPNPDTFGMTRKVFGLEEQEQWKKEFAELQQSKEKIIESEILGQEVR